MAMPLTTLPRVYQRQRNAQQRGREDMWMGVVERMTTKASHHSRHLGGGAWAGIMRFSQRMLVLKVEPVDLTELEEYM